MSNMISKKVATGTGWSVSRPKGTSSSAWGTALAASSPITRIGGNANASTYAATLALAKIAGVVAGDVSYTTIATKSGKTITAPTDWVLVTSRAAGAVITFIYRKVLTASEPANYTWTVASANAAWVVHQVVFRGLDPTTPDASPLNGGGYVITGFGLGPFALTAPRSAFLMAAVADLATSAVFTGDPTLTLERTTHSSTLALATFYEVLGSNAPISRGCTMLPVVQGAAVGIVLNGAP